MSAARDNVGKPMLSFVLQFPTAIKAFSRVKEIGAIKYERDNWRKGGKPDWEYLDAAMRHLTDFQNGEMFAGDTGCTHLSHAMWNIMAIQDLNYPGITHDPELFSTMCQYWELRRESESRGIDFPSVEEFLKTKKQSIDAYERGDYKSTDEVLSRKFDLVSIPPDLVEECGFDTILLEEEMEIKPDQSVGINLNNKTVSVLNEDGEEIDCVEFKHTFNIPA